jgi:hypothetical protein
MLGDLFPKYICVPLNGRTERRPPTYELLDELGCNYYSRLSKQSSRSLIVLAAAAREMDHTAVMQTPTQENSRVIAAACCKAITIHGSFAIRTKGVFTGIAARGGRNGFDR